MANNSTSFVANAAIKVSRFVRRTVGSDHRAQQCVAGERPDIGISHEGSQDTALPGDATASIDLVAAAAGTPVRIYGQDETCEIYVGGTVGNGTYLRPDSDGKGIAAQPGEPYGAIANASATVNQKVQCDVREGVVFGHAGNTPQALSDAGAVDLTTYRTNWTTTGAAAGTLADGLYVGQHKKIVLIVDGGDGTLTPANFTDGTTITFNDAGEFAILGWDGAGWAVVELGNEITGAAGAPVVA